MPQMENKKQGLRDLKNIIKNPEKYAREITIKRLVTILQKMSDYYYGKTEQLVDDDTFDIMVDVLREKDPNNSFLFQTGVSETTQDDIQLPFSMPSLNKIKPGEKSLTKWFNKYTGPYIAMDKLDGISVQIYKDGDGNIDMFTKKQTDMGTSKKYLLEYMVDQKSLNNIPPHTSIRGEVVISKKNFIKIQKYDPNLKNPRSAMAGLLNTDKLDTRIAEKATIVMYNILSPTYTISKQLKKLKKWGFNTVWHTHLSLAEEKEEKDEKDEKDENDEDKDEDEEKEDIIDRKIMTIETKLKDLLKTRKENSKYLVDGIVLADNSKTYLHQSINPKHAMAFKMNVATNMKNVKVEEIIWEPTMYSYLQPVIRIKPTAMDGNVTVTYVTAHNAKYVWDNKIGKGTILKIVRSGDVIPYIVDVIKPSKKADMPTYNYMWNETKVDIIVVDPSEEILKKIKIKQNLHFFKTLGVKYLSNGIITLLYDAGYTTILSLLKASDTTDVIPYSINGLGKKMMTKIYTQIDSAFERVKLYDIMAGSLIFGRGMGVRKLREITKVHSDILDYRNEEKDYLREMILEIEGFSEKLASRFIDNLNNFYTFLEELRNNTNYELLFTSDKKEETKEHLFSGKKVVLTGFRSKDITNFIESNGGKVISTVSKNTNLVVYVPSDKVGSKFNKAQQLGIELMTKTEFENRYFE